MKNKKYESDFTMYQKNKNKNKSLYSYINKSGVYDNLYSEKFNELYNSDGFMEARFMDYNLFKLLFSGIEDADKKFRFISDKFIREISIDYKASVNFDIDKINKNINKFLNFHEKFKDSLFMIDFFKYNMVINSSYKRFVSSGVDRYLKCSNGFIYPYEEIIRYYEYYKNYRDFSFNYKITIDKSDKILRVFLNIGRLFEDFAIKNLTYIINQNLTYVIEFTKEEYESIIINDNLPENKLESKKRKRL